MRYKRSMLVGGLLVLLLLSSASAVRAESSGDSSEDGFYIIILGIIEDPDPIPTISYQLVAAGGDDPCGIDGMARHDGRPDTAYDPQTGSLVVTWATTAGDDYDVAISEWTGDSWTDTAYLATSALDELDPRSHVDASGGTYVVWWKAGSTEKVYLASRDAGAGSWKEPDLVINGGRRPSVTRYGNDIAVTYERDRAGGGQEISIAFIDADGGVFVEFVADTDRTEPLDAIAHYSGGLLWVDWKHSNDEFAYSILGEGGWSEIATVPWSDHSLNGEEITRRMISSKVLSP